jgi:hypothetical protein
VPIRRRLSPVAIYQQYRKVRPKCQQGCKTWPRRSFRKKCRTVPRYTSSRNYISAVNRGFVSRFSRNSQKLNSNMCRSAEPHFLHMQTADRNALKPQQYVCPCADHAPLTTHQAPRTSQSSTTFCGHLLYQNVVSTERKLHEIRETFVRPLRHWLAPRAGLQCRTAMPVRSTARSGSQTAGISGS